jgi:hypothetical protein
MEATMKIIDRTPFRAESGEIDIMGRIRGSLSHGLNWYTRLQAQDTVIAIMDKVLGDKYVLLRNVTLVDTEIELPMLLVGPQGVFLINAIHERGVYRAKDDEWGTVRGEQFVPAAINQVKRTLKLGRVAQVYLERAGFKDLLVDPILMSADPGTHIESTRPAVRVIMSDALERFAISVNQGRAILGPDVVSGVVKTILNGPAKKAEAASSRSSAPMATPSNGGRDTTDALFSGSQQDAEPQGYSQGYSFDESPRPSSQRPPASYQPGTPRGTESQGRPFEDSGFEDTGRSGSNYQDRGFQERGYEERSYQDSGSQGMDFRDSSFQDTGFGDLRSQEDVFRDTDAPVSDASQTATSPFDTSETDVQPETTARRKPAAAKSKSRLGMTTTQMVILGVILLCWLLSMAGFAAYLYLNLNG